MRIWNYKNIFANEYTPNWSEEVFVISRIKNAIAWTFIINDLKGEEIVGTFYEKKKIEKVIKREGNKMYVKWKGYDH